MIAFEEAWESLHVDVQHALKNNNLVKPVNLTNLIPDVNDQECELMLQDLMQEQWNQCDQATCVDQLRELLLACVEPAARARQMMAKATSSEYCIKLVTDEKFGVVPEVKAVLFIPLSKGTLKQSKLFKTKRSRLKALAATAQSKVFIDLQMKQKWMAESIVYLQEACVPHAVEAGRL